VIPSEALNVDQRKIICKTLTFHWQQYNQLPQTQNNLLYLGGSFCLEWLIFVSPFINAPQKEKVRLYQVILFSLPIHLTFSHGTFFEWLLLENSELKFNHWHWRALKAARQAVKI
jgi:hypothetical protein